jgi:hypothetical protein
MRGTLLAPVLCLLIITGCGSGQQSVTIPNASETPAASEPSTQATTATAATPNPAYPVVQWNDEPWPFTLQLVSITKSPEGYHGRGSAPPKWEWLMVRVNITSQTADRTPPTPSLALRCSGPGSELWNPGDAHTVTPMIEGYEQPPGSDELTLPADVGLAYNEPQTWGAEWEVPESTNTSEVTCALEEANRHLLALN